MKKPSLDINPILPMSSVRLARHVAVALTRRALLPQVRMASALHSVLRLPAADKTPVMPLRRASDHVVPSSVCLSCENCKKPFVVDFFCASCEKILPLNTALNHFDLFERFASSSRTNLTLLVLTSSVCAARCTLT